MRTFANLFLILFVADGGFSLIDELVPLLLPLAPFTAFRFLLAGTVVFMAVPMYFALGIDRRLPKRVFLPLIIFVLLCPLSTWFFPVLANVPVFGLVAAAAQTVLGMLPLYHFRDNDGRTLTMPAGIFVEPFFSLRNTLLFGAASLIAVPLAVLAITLSTADSYMSAHTSGFMRVAPDGIRMTERIYERCGKTVRLPAMIHIGNREYYAGLTNQTAPGRVVILAEGVSDNRNLLHNGVDYGKIADYMGLVTQKEMHFNGRIIENSELDSPPDGRCIDIIRADADVSDFHQPTILLLDAIGKHLKESTSLVKGFLALNSWSDKNITPEMTGIIMDDILHRRNMKVISYLEKALAGYDTVVIPWGALHMKEIEAEILKRGFRLQGELERTSIDFRKLLPGV